MKHILKLILPGLVAASLHSCAPYFTQPTKPRAARLGEETGLNADLRRLPAPKEKLVAAVYKFRDQTGQYKPSEVGTNFSTAVTQGATNILLKALDDSGWFVVIERENVSNLLNERKIVRSSMAQYQNQAENLPPLLFGGVILEGGIVSYDANMITGGAGLRYFAAGGSTQYRQDRVTVYLRAVATRSGKILKTVYTSKTILSQSVDGGIFRYVRFKRLLEAETGFTTTEPAQLAVTEAIEKAVQALVLEGVRDNLWTADEKDPGAVSQALGAYEKEKAEMAGVDVYGVRRVAERPALSVQPFGSLMRYQGDYNFARIGRGYGLAATLGVSPHWHVQLGVGTGSARTANFLDVSFSMLEAHLLYRALPFQKTTPFFYAGGGAMKQFGSNPVELSGELMFKTSAGLGVEHLLGRNLALQLRVDYNLLTQDSALDGINAGRYNDSFVRGSGGLVFYLGRTPARRSTPLTPAGTGSPAGN